MTVGEAVLQREGEGVLVADRVTVGEALGVPEREALRLVVGVGEVLAHVVTLSVAVGQEVELREAVCDRDAEAVRDSVTVPVRLPEVVRVPEGVTDCEGVAVCVGDRDSERVAHWDWEGLTVSEGEWEVEGVMV